MRTPERSTGPSVCSRCLKSIGLTVLQSRPYHSAVAWVEVVAHICATLCPSRPVPRACRQANQARRCRLTSNSTGSTNSGRSRTRRITWSWMEVTHLEQPSQPRLRREAGCWEWISQETQLRTSHLYPSMRYPAQPPNNGIQSSSATAGPSL